MSDKDKKLKKGWITLYDADYVFVISLQYHSKSERNKIIDKWKKLYRLDYKNYYLTIAPETPFEHKVINKKHE